MLLATVTLDGTQIFVALIGVIALLFGAPYLQYKLSIRKEGNVRTTDADKLWDRAMAMVERAIEDSNRAKDEANMLRTEANGLRGETATLRAELVDALRAKASEPPKVIELPKADS